MTTITKEWLHPSGSGCKAKFRCEWQLSGNSGWLDKL